MVQLTRRENTPNLFGLQRLNRILDEAFAGLPFPEQGGNILTASWVPPTDVSEDTNSIQITMELAGVDPDDVRISLENNVLTIRGEKQQEDEQDDDRVHRIERIYGMFQRTFVLPNTVDADRIEASYENGVLTVRIPKSERARPREIPVNASQAGASQLRATGSQGAVGQGSEAAGDQSTTQTTESATTATGTSGSPTSGSGPTGEGQTTGNGSEQTTSSRRSASSSRSGGEEGSRSGRGSQR